MVNAKICRSLISSSMSLWHTTDSTLYLSFCTWKLWRCFKPKFRLRARFSLLRARPWSLRVSYSGHLVASPRRLVSLLLQLPEAEQQRRQQPFKLAHDPELFSRANPFFLSAKSCACSLPRPNWAQPGSGVPHWHMRVQIKCGLPPLGWLRDA